MAKHARRFIIPGWIDETIGNIKHFDVQGAYETKPWTPQILPLQIIRLGSIAICGLPFEITTVAGMRLQKTLEDALVGKDGYEHVILCPYSNAYSGYITTTEEYQEQMYEAGHCVFGQWTLNATQQEFHQLAKQMLLPKESRKLSHSILPPDFTEEELEKIKHFESTTAKKEKKREEQKRKLLEKHNKAMNKRTL
jgi:neutral ceramidase